MEKKYTYIFVTISVGEPYLKNSINFAKKLNEISNEHKVLIVSDTEFSSFENTEFVKLPEGETKFIKNYFNYNLKYIPIMEGSKKNFDFVIFIDSDWRISNGYCESKIQNFLKIVDASSIDFVFERPHKIGESKKFLPNCFWKHKIEPYGLMETDFYDSGEVVNEQFMVFKNNEKLKVFCEKWKERNEFGVSIDLWSFAEGLEIGMSAVDAKMNMTWHNLSILSNCFEFDSNQNIKYERF